MLPKVSLGPAPIQLPRRALDLTGHVYGELTCFYPCGSDRQGIQWLCRCDCGRLAIRHAANLRRKGNPCCIQCASESRRGYLISLREIHRTHLLRLFHQTKTLYASASFSLPAQPEEPLRIQTASVGHRTLECPCNGYTKLEGRFLCAVCKRFHSVGWGCLDCGDPVCVPCAVEHRCLTAHECSESVARERLRRSLLTQRKSA